jgi:DNA modification methylase
MSGTGSAQLAALATQRNAYGCELTKHFHEIALDRINNVKHDNDFYLALDDAWNFDSHDRFPAQFDYIITSPPYWDMLNMDGAQTQKTRNRKGLRTNYSELDTDLGNCADYDTFLTRLLKIYNKTLLRLKAGGYFTVIVKNIKKKGIIYTFAWDIVENLSETLDITQINFWLQDDIRIAPYGYGNAWVSNTFHQYCLTFKKP